MKWMLPLFLLLTVTQSPEEWRGLVVAEEQRCSPYTARDYRYPQSVEPRIADRLGGIYSPYTCESFTTLKDTDIEHIVARSEAHDSGMCAASPERKLEFAGDLRNLTLSAPRLNRYVKSDKDATEWVPAENACWFAWRIIEVRRAYGLTIDREESAAIDDILAGCPESSETTRPRCPAVGSIGK